MQIEIDNRLYKDIDSFCKANNINKTSTYIIGIIRKQFNLDKYGDLNEKIHVKTEEVLEVHKVENKNEINSIIPETEKKQTLKEIDNTIKIENKPVSKKRIVIKSK